MSAIGNCVSLTPAIISIGTVGLPMMPCAWSDALRRASRSWSSVPTPEAPVDAALSTALARAASDQKQVAELKEKVYKAAVEAFVAR